MKRIGGVSKFPLSCLLRQDVQNVGFASAFVLFYWVESSSVTFGGNCKISEMCLFLKCSWGSVLEIEIMQTAVNGTVSPIGRPGKH